MKGCFHRSEMWVTVGGSDSVGSVKEMDLEVLYLQR